MSKKNSEENVKLKREQMNLSISDFMGDLPIEDGSILDPTPPTEIYDHDIQIKKCEDKAKKVIYSTFLLFFKESLLTEDEYLKSKMIFETANLKHLLLSLDQLEHVIKNTLIISDSGEFSPKFIDSFSNLQKTKMEVLKNVKLYVNDVEKEFKQIKMDKDTQNLLNPDKNQILELIEQPKEKNIFRGTKDLMMSLRNQ